jgi:hypothetical protein
MKLRYICLFASLALACSCSREQRFKDVFITVDSDNAFKVDNELYDSSTISNKLSDVAKKNPGRIAIHFQCDAQRPFKILNKVFVPAMRLGVWRFTLRLSPDTPPADCSRPAPDPSGGRIYNYTIRVYPNHWSLNGTNSTLTRINGSLQSTGNNYVTVIPKEDVSVKRMYDALLTCKTNSKVLGVGMIDYEMENNE